MVLGFTISGSECQACVDGADCTGDPSFANTAHSRRLISSVLQAVYSHGYELVASTSLTRKWNDKDTLFIRRSSTGPRIRVFFSVSFHSDDKIRIVDPPDEGVRMAFESAVHVSQKLELTL